MDIKLVAKKTTYEVTLAQVKELIAGQLGVAPEQVEIRYNIREVGGDDSLGISGNPTVVSIGVEVKNT
jgi:hypothetical protein